MTAAAAWTTAAEARAARGRLSEDWIRHRRVCGQCRTRPGTTPDYCGDGWEIAKAIAQAGAVIRRFAGQAEAEQGTLF